MGRGCGLVVWRAVCGVLECGVGAWCLSFSGARVLQVGPWCLWFSGVVCVVLGCGFAVWSVFRVLCLWTLRFISAQV